ncbi:hypothetical protein F2P56_014820, partial [Juglans regia]
MGVTWRLIKELCSGDGKAWLVCGDFNEILMQNEKNGGKRRPESQLDDFREMLDTCALKDLGYSGSPFTWGKNKEGRTRIWERLERCFANSEWIHRYPHATIIHGAATYSNHIPKWIEPHKGVEIGKGKRMFKFEAIRLGETECDDIIEDRWKHTSRGGGGKMGEVMDKIAGCSQKLQVWNKRKFGNVQVQVARAQRRLQYLQERSHRGSSNENLKKAKEEVHIWLEREEVMWRQRSKALWLKEGDKNSRYFHMKASQRRRKNKIVRLQDEQGNWQEG